MFKYLGASYLLYIGIKGVLATKQTANHESIHSLQEISSLKALGTGFLTNALNPKAMLFFLSLISAFIPGKPPIIIAIYGVIIFTSTLLWFLFVAMCFSNKRLRSFFKNFQYLIERITGGLLILLALKMLFASLQS